MTNTTEPAGKPRRSWARTLLVVSLALNLLVVGVVVGAALRFAGPEPLRTPSRTMGIEVIRLLPPEERRDMFRRAREAGGGDQARDMRAFIAALQANPFDRGVAAAVIFRQAAVRRAFEASLQAALLDKLDAMTPEQRADYAARLQSAKLKHDKKKRDSHK